MPAVVAVGVDQLALVGFLFHPRFAARLVGREVVAPPVRRPDGEVVARDRQAAPTAVRTRDVLLYCRKHRLLVVSDYTVTTDRTGRDIGYTVVGDDGTSLSLTPRDFGTRIVPVLQDATK